MPPRLPQFGMTKALKSVIKMKVSRTIRSTAAGKLSAPTRQKASGKRAPNANCTPNKATANAGFARVALARVYPTNKQQLLIERKPRLRGKHLDAMWTDWPSGIYFEAMTLTKVPRQNPVTASREYFCRSDSLGTQNANQKLPNGSKLPVKLHAPLESKKAA